MDAPFHAKVEGDHGYDATGAIRIDESLAIQEALEIDEALAGLE